MAHIHTQPGHHDQTASAYIIRTDGSEWRIVLHWHKKLNGWLQFGGHVELHENPWQAVTHEIAEESGYNLSQLKLLQPKQRLTKTSDAIMHPVPFYDQTHPFPGIDHYHTDRGYVMFTEQEPAGKIAAGESSKFKLFTLKELEALPLSDIPIDVKEIAEYVMKINVNDWTLVNANEVA